MKFFLPSAAVVLTLALCAQSVPAQQGQGAEVANQKPDQDRRLWSEEDKDKDGDHHGGASFKEEGCYYYNDGPGTPDNADQVGTPILVPVGYHPTVSNQDCYEYCISQTPSASYFGLSIVQGGLPPNADVFVVDCRCFNTGKPASLGGKTPGCILDRGSGVGNGPATFKGTIEFFSITPITP